MQADSPAVLNMTPAKITPPHCGRFARGKKVATPQLDRLESGADSGGSSQRRLSKANSVALAECAAAADVTPKNICTSFESSVDSLITEELPERQCIHALRDFLKIYRVRKLVGRGSYSVVFEVINRTTKEKKAAKFLVGKYPRHTSRKKSVENDVKETKTNDNEERIFGDKAASTVLPETLVREIAVSLTVHHPNLVRTSDVFVEDTEDLKRRVRRYNSNLCADFPSLTRMTAKWRVKQEPRLAMRYMGSTLLDSSGRSKLCDSRSGSNTRSSGFDEQRRSTRACVTTASPAGRESAADNNETAIYKVKQQLQEGQVQCILVMELLSSQDLFSLVCRHPLNEAKAAAYMMDLLLALRHLHSHQIVHRDVKVENIVLDPHDRARLIDYGFCEGLKWPREKSAVRGSGADLEGYGDGDGDRPLTQFCGSYHYVAPEVIRTAMHSRFASRPGDVKIRAESVNVKFSPVPVNSSKTLGSHAISPTSAGRVGEEDSCGMHSAASTRALRILLTPGPVGYGTPVDLWSAGVVMFVLLHSTFPFHDKHLSKLLKIISSGRQQVRPSPLLSSDAKDLLRRLLTPDMRCRLTAAQAVEHPWFKKQLAKGERRETELF